MKKKMIWEYLKTSFGAVFFTLVLGGFISYLVLVHGLTDETLPQYLIADIQNYLAINETEVKISELGLAKLEKHHCWLQVIDIQGNVVGSVNADKKLPEHYSPYELVYYTLNSGMLNQDTLFVNEILEHPGYGVIIGCNRQFVQKRSVIISGRHSIIKGCAAFFIVTIFVVYLSSCVFSRKITTPIIKIMENISRIAKGMAIEESARSSIFAGVFSQLVELQYRLQENKRMRTEWIANISHDMKTPLSTIRGYAELLADESYQFEIGEVRACAREIAKSERYIENLIQDLRLSQKLVEGKMPLQKKEVSMLSMIQNSIGCIEYTQNQREVVTIDCDEEVYLCCDPNLMERCFVNIISNAFIHNPDNVRVIVRVSRSHNNVILEIQDNGRGMDEEESRHIFERYYHGTNSQQRGGTGLGLAIAKETVEAHGGTIAVKSQKNSGTTFVIQLPEGAPLQLQQNA